MDRCRRGDPAGFAEFLEQNSADVFVVLDADPAWVAAARESTGTYRVVPGPAETSSWVFAKVPITDLAHPAEAGLPSAALQFTVQVGAAQAGVLALHTRSPITPGGAGQRDDALLAVTQWDRHQPPGPRVVTGDFHATQWSASLRQLLSDSSLEDSNRGFGYQPTFPARVWPLAVPIDQSLHSSQLITTARSTGPTFGSEHNSLIVTYAVAGAPKSG